MAARIGEILLTLLLIAILAATCVQSKILEGSCNVTRKVALKEKYQLENIYILPQTDESLTVCPRNRTCCKRALESNLQRKGEIVLGKVTEPFQRSIRYAFTNSSKKFAEFFKGLVHNSFKGLDDMFTRTYKEKYTVNKDMFAEFFNQLQTYVKGTDVDLKQLVDGFFAVLYQKVYILFNDLDRQLDSRYENCILQSVDTVHPFGDSPRKIAVQISRSFLASRVLLESLKVGHQVIQELLQLKANGECSKAFTRLTECGLCHNLDGIKPCYNFCLNVVKGCFAYPSVVNAQWNEYISALQKLTNKLEGPFSMEAIIEPLGVKISEAIMVYQEHKINITKNVEKLCGIAPVRNSDSPSDKASRRRKRETFPFEFLGMTDQNRPRPTTAAGTSLDRLLRDLRKVLEPLQNHWVLMANNVCSSGIAEQPTNVDRCWNGQEAGRYTQPVVTDGIPGMFLNPEVHLNISDPKITIKTQVIRLKEMTQRIQNAVYGADSTRIDIEEGSGKVSGDGESGSGSGRSTAEPQTTPTRIIPGVPTTKTDEIENTVDECVRHCGTDKKPTKSPNDIPDKYPNNDPQNSVKAQVGKHPGNAVTLTSALLLQLLCLACYMFTSW